MKDLITSFSLSPEFLELYNVEAAFSSALAGGTLKQIAKEMGMPLRSFMRLRFENASFKQALDHAREQGREAIHDGIRSIVDDNLFLPPQLVKIKSDNDMWFLKTSDPVKYGDRVLVQSEDINLKDALSQARTRVIEHTPKEPDNPFDGS
jgi:cytidylate kinase